MIRTNLFIIMTLLFWSAVLACCKFEAADGLPPRPTNPVISPEVRIVDAFSFEQGDSVFLVGLIDNTSFQWQKVWVRVEFLDAAGAPVSVAGQKDLYVPGLAPKVPPQGRTAYSIGFSKKLAEKPWQTVRMAEGLAEKTTPGGIPIAEDFNGYIETIHVGEHFETPVDVAWNVRFTIRNILPTPVQKPTGVALFYGNDQRLWVAKSISPADAGRDVFFEKTGPLNTGDSTKVGFKLMVASLPQKLQEIKIGKAEVLAFDNMP